MDVVADAQLAEHGRFLRQVTEAEARAPMHGQAGNVLAIQHDAAGVGRHQPDDHVERRGLARTVRAEQPDDFAARYFQRQVFDDLTRTILFGESLYAQQTHAPLSGCG